MLHSQIEVQISMIMHYKFTELHFLIIYSCMYGLQHVHAEVVGDYVAG